MKKVFAIFRNFFTALPRYYFPAVFAMTLVVTLLAFLESEMASGQNRLFYPISIKVQGLNQEQIERFRVYRVCMKNDVKEILLSVEGHDQNVLFNCRELYLTIPRDIMNIMTNLTVIIGKRQFDWTPVQLQTSWIKVEKDKIHKTIIENLVTEFNFNKIGEDVIVLKSPPGVRSESFIYHLPFISSVMPVINFSNFTNGNIMRDIVFSWCVYLVLVIITLVYLTVVSRYVSRILNRARIKLSSGESPLKNNVLLLSLVVNIILFGLFFFIFPVRYETNDDVSMMMIASGFINGHPDDHLIFINVIIGKLLKFLYQITGQVNWYSLFLFFIHFISSVFLLFAFLKKEFSYLRILFYLMLFFLYEVPMLMLLQFTHTAFVAGQAGLFLFLTCESKNWRRCWILLLCSFILFTTSGLIRAPVFQLIFVLAFPILVLRFINTGNFTIPVFAVGTFLIFFMVNHYDRQYYQREPGWKYYYEYNLARGALQGTERLDNTPEWVYKKIGWSENDKNLFKSFSLLDQKIYSLKNLQYLLSHSQNRREKMRVISEFTNMFKSSRINIVFMLLSLVMSFLFVRKGERWNIYLTLLFVMIVMAYLSQIRLPHHVYLPMIFMINVMILYLGEDMFSKLVDYGQKESAGFRIAVFAELFALVILCQASLIYMKSMDNRKDIADVREDLRVLMERKDALLVFSGGILNLERLSVFSNLQEYKSLNIVFTGWFSNSPITLRTLERFQIRDLYSALFERDNVLILVVKNNTGKCLKRFMWEHYQRQIDYIPVIKKLNYYKVVLR